MFSFSFLFSLLVLLLAFDTSLLQANAHPAKTHPSLKSIAIPLSPWSTARAQSSSTNASSSYTHGSIVQQQHLNRGIKRLASMTGRTAPSDYDLLQLLFQRISNFPAEVQRGYNVDEIKDALLAWNNGNANIIINATKPVTGGSAMGHSSRSRRGGGGAVVQGRASTTPNSPLHTTGLKIESNDVGYIANAQIGTPFKTFRLLVDSGSADLWVGAAGCRSDDGGGCGKHSFLGPKTSSSYSQSTEDWAIGYVSGSVWGYLVQDVVSFAGLTLKNHTFGVAFNESSDFTGDDIPFDGLLGLSKSDVSQQHVPTFLQSLSQANLITSPIASYKLPRLADGKNDTGELTLGAMDPNHYYPKSLVTVKNVNKFGFWGAAVDAVKVGSKNMHWANRTIVMDTGTTLIIAPEKDVEAIHKAIPGAQNDGSGWTVPCNMTTVLALTIGGKAFTIDPRDIAFYPVMEGSADCMSGIGAGGVGPFYKDTDWLVGDVFLKNVYFSTDEENDEISIAKPLY